MWQHSPKGVGSHNLSESSLSPAQHRLLGLGPNFVIRPRKVDGVEWERAVWDAKRRLALKDFFSRPETPTPIPPKASGSMWTPPSVLWNTLANMVVPQITYDNRVMLNLSRTLKQALKDFKARKDLMVTLTDKNMGMAVIAVEDYQKRVLEELGRTPDAFRPLAMSVSQLNISRVRDWTEVRNILERIRDPGIMSQWLKAIGAPFLKELRTCKLFGLPKVHKKGTRMRLIFPMSSHPWSILHKFLARSIDHFVVRQSTVIFSVMEIVHKLDLLVVAKGTLLAAADIATFYPSVNRQLAINTAVGYLQLDPAAHIFSRDQGFCWRTLFRLAHKDIEFEFADKLYEQIKGVPIGSPSGPQLAILALHHQIRRRWDTVEALDPIIAGLYFDDFIGVFKKGSASEVRTVLDNLLGSGLRFDDESFVFRTAEELIKKPLPVLDIEIYAKEIEGSPGEVMLRTRVYTKPMGAYQYVPWTSAHPPSVKRAIIKGELSRRSRLCSTREDWIITTKDLQAKLEVRGYPRMLLQQMVNDFDWNSAGDRRLATIKKIQRRRETAVFPWTSAKVPVPRSIKVPLIVRYDPRSLPSMKRLRNEFQDAWGNIPRGYIEDFRLVMAFKVGKRLLRILQENPQEGAAENIEVTG